MTGGGVGGVTGGGVGVTAEVDAFGLDAERLETIPIEFCSETLTA